IPDNYYGKAKITALTLSGVDPQSSQGLHAYLVKEGRFLRSSDGTSAVIATTLAETLGLKLGDKLTLPTSDGEVDLKIVGILPARAVPGNEEIFVTLVEAQKLLDLSNRISSIEINLDTMDDAQRESIRSQIENVLGRDFTLDALSGGSEIIASIKVGQVAFNLIGFLSIFMGGFIIFNTFRTIVAERRHDIGMLRAIGANRRTIITMILVEGLIQGVVGTFLGLVFGYLMGLGLTAMMSPLMAQYIHVELGAPVVSPGLVVVTILSGIGMTLIAGVLPAINASHVTPLEALRPSMNPVQNSGLSKSVLTGLGMIVLAAVVLFSANSGLIALGALLLLVGMVLAAPALVRPIASVFNKLVEITFARDGTAELAQNNLSRNPSRAAITASATMIGIAVIVGIGGMIWSMTGGFMGILQRSLGSDYLVMPPAVGLWKDNVGAKQDLADRLRSVPGVAVVSTLRYSGASVNGQSISMLGIDPVAYPKVASLTFAQGDAKTAFNEISNDRAIIANGVFSSQTGLKLGDSFQLSTPTGSKTYRVAAIANDFLNAKIMTAYISQGNLQSDFRKNEDIFFQINLLPGVEASQVEPRFKKIMEDYSQFKLVSGKSYFEENKQMFDSVIAVYFVILIVLAVPSLIALLNTLTIGVIERTREIGMLRAIGAIRKQISQIVLAEALLLAAVGTAFGLLAGLYLGYVMVLGLAASGYPIFYVFPYQGLLMAIATGLIFGVLAALLPARQAARMDIIQALRYE
ncbi:MAG: FtsX-like permease family protein, partial [Anaerolineae bacterium]|nr:FtsX-like permease family protein [Anaerolineae bacterium]